MKKETTHPDYHRCVACFLEAYERITGFQYVFTGKDGKALKEILKSIETIKKPEADTFDSFNVMMQRLPAWVTERFFSLPNISKYFNQIIKQIKDESSNGNKNSKISSDYKRNIAESLCS